MSPFLIMSLIGENLHTICWKPYILLYLAGWTTLMKMTNTNNYISFVYIENIYKKNMFARFWCYRVYSVTTNTAINNCLNYPNLSMH